MKIPQKSRHTNGFYTNGTGSTRNQMRHIIYINIDKGNGEPSIYMFSHLPFHPLTLTISLPFPLTFPHHIPNIPIYPFPFSPFLLTSQSFSYISHPRCTFRLSSLPLLPSLSIHLTITYNPYTPTLHPLPHVFPHPPTHTLLTTLYALVSIFSRSLALPPITHSCIFHMKHNDNNSYFHFHIIYYIILYYMYLCPLHIVSTCLLSSIMNYESIFTIANLKM